MAADPERARLDPPPVVLRPAGEHTSPADGFQHFGEVDIDARTRAFTVNLRDREGVSLWRTTLSAPRR